MIESIQMGLETVAGAVFDSAEFANSAAEFKFQIGKIFEGSPSWSLSFYVLVIHSSTLKISFSGKHRSASTVPFFKMD